MKRSRALLTLIAPLILSSVLAAVGSTPVEARGRHGYFSFRVHGPLLGFGFGYRYRPHPYYRPYVRLGSPYPYYYRPVYARASSRPRYVSYQSYAYGLGAIRTLVNPKRAEVYVDGYYAGIVDDFDGTFQKLYLAPGEHVVELRLEGHRTFQQRVLVSPRHTQKIHHEMAPLDAGETETPAEPGDEIREENREIRDRSAPPPTPPVSSTPEPPTLAVPRSASRLRFGVLTLRVQPAAAEVRIDGEIWGHIGGIAELSIHLPAGMHGIELFRNGQVVFSTDVDILMGRATPLNIKLGP